MISEARLLRRSWPDQSIDLLVKAFILPLDEARAAWMRWTASRSLDDATWHEDRILSPLSRRIAELDPTSTLRPRIEGLARSRWTRTQLTLGECAESLDLLDRAGIPCLLIKGAAQYAEGLGASTRRILADIDILVRPEHAAEAINVLAAAGWSGTEGESSAYLRTIADLRLSTSLRKGRYGEVDIHRTPFHYRRPDPIADEALWADARPARLHGRPAMVPSPAAGILISFAHSIQSHGGDWAIDVAERLRTQTIDWDALVDLATRWCLTLPTRSGLVYLKEQLGLSVPTETLDRLARAPADWADRLKFWSNIREQGHRPLVHRVINRIANQVLARRGYDVPVSDRKRLDIIQPLGAATIADVINYVMPDRKRFTVIRPLPLAALTLFRSGQLIALQPEAATWSTHATLAVGPNDHGSRLALEFEFLVPRRSRWVYFDLLNSEKVFARIRAQAGGRRAGSSSKIAALVRLPPGRHTEISIEARPTQFIPPTGTGPDHDLIDALPFRIVRAAMRR